jgi:hypothetical protein
MKDDLESFIQSIADLDRAKMILALANKGDAVEAIAHRSGSVARRTRRGPEKDQHRNREAVAREMVGRIGKILFFLRHGTPATNTREEDWALCIQLRDKLRSKGQWQ